MADASWTAEKEHGRGHALGEHHGVVAGAADHAVWPAPCGDSGGFESAGQRRVHGGGGLLHLLDGVEREPSGGGDRVGPIEQVADGGEPDRVVRVADVEAYSDLVRNDVGRAGQGVDAPNGGDQARGGGAFALDFGDPLRRAGKSVVAQMHGGGSGMVGLAIESQRVAALADNRLDDPQAEVKSFQHRPLLDVEFDVGEGGGMQDGLRNRGRVETELLDDPGDGVSLGVPLLEQSSISPMRARLPMNGTPKRTPSSSEKATTSTS